MVIKEYNTGRLRFERYDSKEDPGVRKYVIEFADTESIEAVLVPHPGNYFSLCVSCAIGCPMHCRFCSTGKQQFRRMLGCAEIVRQLQIVIDDDFSGDLQVVSFMGMGEPLLNYKNVIEAARSFRENWSVDRILLSTAGIPRKILQLANDLDIELYLSLVSTYDRIRSSLIPYRPYYRVKQLLDALEIYSSDTGNTVTISCLLLDHINDREVDATRLVGMIKERDIQAVVSLREFCPNDSPFRVSRSMNRFSEILEGSGIQTEIFVSKGRDISGGCGQLKQHFLEEKKTLVYCVL